MPQSLASLNLHIVFSTKDRLPFLAERDLREQMHAYLGGIAKNKGCQPLGIGGVEDHVHILVGLSRSITVADLIRDLKSNSSSWGKKGVPAFSWQSGYGAFTFGSRDLERERLYVRNQEQHHSKHSFQDEFREFLRESGLEWDEKYVWD